MKKRDLFEEDYGEKVRVMTTISTTMPTESGEVFDLPMCIEGTFLEFDDEKILLLSPSEKAIKIHRKHIVCIETIDSFEDDRQEPRPDKKDTH